MIKFVSDLLHVGSFLRVLRVSSTNKTDHHDITEILLKVALNTISHIKRRNQLQNNEVLSNIISKIIVLFEATNRNASSVLVALQNFGYQITSSKYHTKSQNVYECDSIWFIFVLFYFP